MRPLQTLFREAAAEGGSTGASRRGLLAIAGSMAAAPVVAGMTPAFAQDAEKNNDKKKNQNAKKKDIEILNFALTLEHLEYAFYRDGLAQFTAADFSGGKDAQLFARLGDIRAHEKTHVDFLINTIRKAGGKVVKECKYDFGEDFTDPDGFLKIAQTLENTGVMAYDGAIALITKADYQTAGATIATVEARHASYLNFINGSNPFPTAFDVPKTMNQILAAASDFIVSCPS